MAEHQRPAAGELEAWTAKVSAALDLPAGFSPDIAAILDLARDVAHGVARPAAPLTTFLVGYAAGAQGADARTIERLSDLVAALAVSEGAKTGDAVSPNDPVS